MNVEFYPQSVENWPDFVRHAGDYWEEFYMSWGKKFAGEVLIVMYDDLVDSTEAQLRRILNFLDIDVDDQAQSSLLELIQSSKISIVIDEIYLICNLGEN